MENQKPAKKGVSSFPGLFWLVIMFEFFERGSYYGMMSILSVYLTEHLHFAKESVGIIKGTIQPLLYFLPIISGALADRFGYRKMLMIAFSLLGMGYFLTAQATSYALVFGALVVMGFGAGTFKPIISGTIARVTDEENSTLGFGIFYWTINLGAFLFPLILVPILKKMDWSYVIIASAIGTAAMLIPTFFFYKDPVKPVSEEDKSKQTNIIQTLANAFEIIYSPVVLLFNMMKQTLLKRSVILFILAALFTYSLIDYLKTPLATEKFPTIGIQKENTTLIFKVDRNMLAQDAYNIRLLTEDSSRIALTLFKPGQLDQFAPALLDSLRSYPDLADITMADLESYIKSSDQKIGISITRGDGSKENYEIVEEDPDNFKIILHDPDAFEDYQANLEADLKQNPKFAGITGTNLRGLYSASNGRSFFFLYVIGIIMIGLAIINYSSRGAIQTSGGESSASYTVPFFVVSALGLVLWFIPGLTTLGRIVSFIIFISVTSLFIIDKSDSDKFKDHAKFLLMIFLYSGFWILYFQMFDSVLWYVQAYVDAESLNIAINKFLGIFGLHINWFFDVEHVTVINAGTIIMLQLLISNIVKTKKALPTMITGIGIGTIGMAILAISTDIWIFLLGIVLFSVGEMTAHPKFISYIGLTAPQDKKAMYMGYLFLYGVFGSSIGGIMGARLYVHFVDNLNQPKTLWLVFSCIGVATILALLLYNRFLAPKDSKH
jgi:dipeptide/tripeptide permease